jgi:intein/homing endonuclease
VITLGKKPIQFKLKADFKDTLSKKPTKWGYEGLSEFTFYRTYARKKENGRLETWPECVVRVIEGMFSILKTHAITSHLPWDEKRAHKLAEEAAIRLFELKWTPPGRGLWIMGTDYMWERGAMSLYNCTYASTEDIDSELSKPFAYVMDTMMCGVGSGYDTLGAGKILVRKPQGDPELIVVEDTREGWVEAISCLIDSYFEEGSNPVTIDVSRVRPYGTDIKGFGGVASGPEPLVQGFNGIKEILETRDGQLLTSGDIVSIMGVIGKIVVAGNVRRCLPATAKIMTSEGLKTIADIRAGDYVVTGGKEHLVLEQAYSGKQNTIILKHRAGKLECTPNHRVAVYNSIGSYEFKAARDIKVGDRLVWDTAGYDGSKQLLPALEETLHFNATPFSIPSEVTTDIAWLIGIIQGDGYIGPKDIEIATITSELDVLEKCNTIFADNFGIKGKITKVKDKNAFRLRIHSASLARWFASHVKKPNSSIHIPAFITDSTRSVRAAYLAGLFDSDGRGRSDGVIEQVTTIYASLKDEVISLLASLGIGVSVYKVDRSKQENCSDAYSVKITGNTNRKTWANLVSKYIVTDKLVYSEGKAKSPIDFSYPVSWFEEKPSGYKKDGNVLVSSSLIEPDTYYPTEVVEILSGRNTDTYDIEVKDVKQFTTDGIVVHNSALIALGDGRDEGYVTIKNWDKNPVGMGIRAPEEMALESQAHYDAYNSWETSWDEKSAIAKLYQDRVWSWKLGGWLWASNNSLYAVPGQDYSSYVDSIAQNGEPGFFWLDTARNYGRLKDGVKTDDLHVKGCNPCVSGDTMIAVADGRNAVSIKQLAEEGKDIPVYCVNDLGQTTVSLAQHPRVTGKNKQLYKVTLDDGTSIRATDNHEFYLPSGERRPLRDLTVGTSLMARRKWVAQMKPKSQDYVWVSHSDNNNKNKAEHRLFAEFVLGRKLTTDEVVHHKNYKGLNNSLDNLEVMTSADHDELHAAGMRGEKNPYHRMTSEWKEHFHKPKFGADNGMFGKQHSEAAKQVIGDKSKLRWQDPSYREKMSIAIKATMAKEETKLKLSDAMKDRYNSCERIVITEDEINGVIERKETNWVSSGKLYFVLKTDLIDGQEFIVPFADRHINTRNAENGFALQAISANRTKHAKAKEKISLLVDEVKKYIVTNTKIPTSIETASIAKSLDFDYRIKSDMVKIAKASDVLSLLAEELNIDSSIFNPYSLKNKEYNTQVAKQVLSNDAFSYNHKIVSIELDAVEDVYCMTVPAYSNFCVIGDDGVTAAGKPRYSLIPVANCAEIQLESYEVCNLNENYPASHNDYWDFQRTLKFSYLYSKAVTLLPTHWKETNAIIAKNRRIGSSVSGIQEAFIKFGRKEFLNWLDGAYDYVTYLDKKYSSWLGVPQSVRKTTVKPSGTVSLLAGALPGIHHTESSSYYRTVRLSANSPIVDILKASNYRIEPAASDPTRTLVVYFPVLVSEKLPSKKDVSIWQQFKDVSDLQKVWADNMVSVTVTFGSSEVSQIAPCLSAFDSELKSVSLLPYSDHGYVQAPYIAADRSEVEAYAATLLPLDFSQLTDEGDNAESNKFCSNDGCAI